MITNFNLYGLYEQAAVDADALMNQEGQNNVNQTSAKESSLFNAPLNADRIKKINELISKGEGLIKFDDAPLTISGADNLAGTIDNKPVYLAIRITSKNNRAAGEVQLTQADRTYLLLDTKPEELQGWISAKTDANSPIRVMVKSAKGNRSIDLWTEENTQTVSTTEPSSTEVADVKAHQDQLAAVEGVTATNEQYTASAESTNVVKPNIKPVALGPNLTAVKSQTKGENTEGPNEKGALIVRIGKGKIMAAFSENGTVMLYLNNNKILEGTYSNGGTIIKVNKAVDAKYKDYVGKEFKNSFWTNLNKLAVEPGKTVATPVSSTSMLKIGSKGDEVKSLQTKMGIDADGKFGPKTKAAVIDLQKKLGITPDGIVGPKTKAAIENAEKEGKNISQIVAGTEAKKEESKFKVGDIVYYTTAEVKGEVTTSTTPEENKEPKKAATNKFDAIADRDQESYKTGKIGESVIPNFKKFIALTEEDTAQVDGLQADLIKKWQSGNIKVGTISKIISNEKIAVKDKEENEIEILTSSIIDSQKAKDAKVEADKLKAQDGASSKTAGEQAKDRFEQEKKDTATAKANKKEARKEYKEKKKDVKTQNKFDRKSERQDRKQARQEKKAEKWKEKTENLGESKVWTFEEFIKANNSLSND